MRKNEYQPIHKRMNELRCYIKNKPLWMENQREWMTLSELDYHERITDKRYNKVIIKLDKLAHKLNKLLTDKLSHQDA
jgi:hypothetical protein